MTVVLQLQFWDMIVTDDRFEVGLSFNGVPERLVVPFRAIKGFVDPSVQFGLQFAVAVEGDDAAEAAPADGETARVPARHDHSAPPPPLSRWRPPRPGVPPAPTASPPPAAKSSASTVFEKNSAAARQRMTRPR